MGQIRFFIFRFYKLIYNFFEKKKDIYIYIYIHTILFFKNGTSPLMVPSLPVPVCTL